MSSNQVINFLSKKFNTTKSSLRPILQYYRNRRSEINTISDHRHHRSNIPSCDVFINHRGIDTKRSVAGLLHHHLSQLGLRPFLDRESLKPGDSLFEKINEAIRKCEIGVAVFSPHYCESYFCLHELALLMECKKKVIPVFCDIKPSELRVSENCGCSADEIKRFALALKEARYTVGITFDSNKGNWSDLLTTTTDIIMKTLMEVKQQEKEKGKGKGVLQIKSTLTSKY